MKKYDKIMERVRHIEEKNGISYPKTDGKLFKSLLIFYIIATIYTLIISVIYILGIVIIMGPDKYTTNAINSMTTVGLFSLMLVVAVIMIYRKLKITGFIISLISSISLTIQFGLLLKDSLGYFGLKPKFYYCHLAPTVIIVVTVIVMAIIHIRSEYKTNKLYKKTVEQIYKDYNVSEKNLNNISEDQWNDILNNYDPKGYKKQF